MNGKENVSLWNNHEAGYCTEREGSDKPLGNCRTADHQQSWQGLP